MKTNDEIRRLRLLKAAEIAGSMTKLAELADCNPVYLSQIKNKTPRGTRKTPTLMGDETARKIELAIGKPPGWMDDGSNIEISGFDAASSHPGEIEIPQFDVRGSMGHGKLLLDGQPGIIRNWNVDEEWVNSNVPRHTGIKNLCIVTGFGDSMLPMFNPGDPLLVDCGVTEADHDAVYFFRVNDHGYIKRLQRIPKGTGTVMRAKSKNPDYDSFDIDETMDFQVLGKVLIVWRSERF
ncbi:MAG TPA: S24 family peptidase [Burkholderiaceae bacterium]